MEFDWTGEGKLNRKKDFELGIEAAGGRIVRSCL
jgi:hypothetical protein